MERSEGGCVLLTTISRHSIGTPISYDVKDSDVSNSHRAFAIPLLRLLHARQAKHDQVQYARTQLALKRYAQLSKWYRRATNRVDMPTAQRYTA